MTWVVGKRYMMEGLPFEEPIPKDMVQHGVLVGFVFVVDFLALALVGGLFGNLCLDYIMNTWRRKYDSLAPGVCLAAICMEKGLISHLR